MDWNSSEDAFFYIGVYMGIAGLGTYSSNSFYYAMTNRSKNSNVEVIEYRKKEENND